MVENAGSGAMSPMKDAAAFDFDGEYGKGYDTIARTVIPAYDQIFGLAVTLLEPRVATSAHVLIAGTGTGRELDAFARARPNWQFTAVDPSSAMIDVSARVAARAGASHRVRFHRGLVSDLDARGFDAATLFNVMHFLPDDGSKAALIASLAERVRPGGWLVLFDLHGDPGTEGFGLLLDAWYRYMEWNGLTGEPKRRFIDRLDRGIAWVPEQRVIELCDDAGFDVVLHWYTVLLYGGWLFRRRA